MYTKPVGEIINRYYIKYNYYADDTQVYITLKSCDKWDDSSSSIKTCIEQGIWRTSNTCKSNKVKTEFIVYSPKQQLKI